MSKQGGSKRGLDELKLKDKGTSQGDLGKFYTPEGIFDPRHRLRSSIAHTEVLKEEKENQWRSWLPWRCVTNRLEIREAQNSASFPQFAKFLRLNAKWNVTKLSLKRQGEIHNNLLVPKRKRPTKKNVLFLRAIIKNYISIVYFSHIKY